MPFQIKDFTSITASQINHAKAVTDKITDFVPGSVARTLMEAPAVEIEELYIQMFLGLRDAIPVATFLSFGFDRLPASAATGYVSVSSHAPMGSDLLVPSGTAFIAADGRVYTSTAAVLFEEGATIIQVPVAYAEAGVVGNAAEGVITSSPYFSLDQYTVNNAAIVTGRDVESDAEREARFADFVQSMSRGTVVACTYAARQSRVLDGSGNIAEYVTRVGLHEEPGHVRLYLYSSLGTPSAELLADGQTRIDGFRDEVTGAVTPGFRAAGVQVDVLAMVERAVPLSIKVDMLPGYTLTPSVIQRLGDIFSTQVTAAQPGTVLYLGTVLEAMLAATGVQEIVPVTSENFLCGVNEALTPGTLTVTTL